MDYGKWIMLTLAALIEAVPQLVWFLLVLMVLDALLGTLSVLKQGRERLHEWAWNGSTRKLGSLTFIAIAAAFDHYVGIPGVNTVMVTTAWYIGPECISILRNAAILELPVPPQLARVLSLFADNKDNDANKPLS